MINYFTDNFRDTPINLAVGRALISGLMLWKLVQYEWAPLGSWPYPLRDWVPIFRHPILLNQIDLIVFLCAVFLTGVLLGYRLRLSAFSSAILLTYLGIIRHAYQTSHDSRILFNASLIILLFAIFAEEDLLTVDQLRRTRLMSLDTLVQHLEGESGNHRHRALKWTLVIIGFFYFQAGLSKLLFDPVAWIAPANLSRYVLFRSGGFVGDIILEYPTLATLGAIATIFLEIGFLIAIVSRMRIWHLYFGLIGMHIAILFSVGPDFSDQIVILGMLLPWDKGFEYMQPDEEVSIIYDRHCYFCVRSLHIFRYLDGAGNVRFFNQYTIPHEFDTQKVDFEEAMYAHKNDKWYKGYFAFIELFNSLGFLRPMSVFMKLPGIQSIGQIIYRHIATNRSRYFICSVQDD